MEAYFTSCHSALVPIARLEVIPTLPSPKPCTLGACSRFFVYPLHKVQRTGWLHKHIFTTVSLVFTLVAVPQSSNLTTNKTWTGQLSLSYMSPLSTRFP